MRNNVSTTYQYDVTNELTNDGTNSYSYDLNGNRNYGSYTTGSANELTNDGTWTYTYDNNGNLTKKSKGASAETWYFGYDVSNRMTSAKQEQTDGGTLLMQATYVYDVYGNRLEKDVWTQQSGTTTKTRFAYDGQNAFADLDGNNNNALLTRRLYGDTVDQLFARENANGVAYYLTDRLGSVRDIVNGTVLDHIDYDGFGNATESNSTNGDRYKWTAREFDNETGLQYNRARYFDPKAGRWDGQDPLVFKAGDFNLYRYVHNNPLSASDPSGLRVARAPRDCERELEDDLAYAQRDYQECVRLGLVPQDVCAARWAAERAAAFVRYLICIQQEGPIRWDPQKPPQPWQPPVPRDPPWTPPQQQPKPIPQDPWVPPIIVWPTAPPVTPPAPPITPPVPEVPPTTWWSKAAGFIIWLIPDGAGLPFRYSRNWEIDNAT